MRRDQKDRLSMSVMIRGGKNSRAKESFFVRVPDPNGGVPTFFNATAYIGKVMPYQKPQATCAMRVDGNVVAFSLLHLTKRSMATVVTQEISMPRSPLARLTRRAQSLELAAGEIVVEMDDVFYKLRCKVDDNGTASLEMAEGPDGSRDDVTFNLPLTSAKISVYLRSPKVDRTIAIGFIGHLGKPNTPELVSRATAMVLNSVSGLVEFRLLSGVETCKVPAAPTKWSTRPPVRKAEDRVAFELAVQLFAMDSSAPAGEVSPENLVPVGSGSAVIEVDLENANPTTGRLLYHITPSEEIAEQFGSYRDVIDGAITTVLKQRLGEELTQITFEVVLGEVDSGTLGRLRDALDGLTSIDVTPEMFQFGRAS